MTEEIFSVSEINEYIKTMLDADGLLSRVYVRGELSNYKMYPSGHHYFTMKDENGAIRCVMFKGAASKLKFRPENGMKVIACGRVTVFPRDGQYQLYCTSLTADGIGDLHVAFEQLKEKLYKEGLFDPAHKKALPQYPERIAIITSSAGAAVHDMLRILGKRYPLAKAIILPVRVQGVEAPPEIVGAIRYCNRHNIADLIITGRGGGSIEDLWAFNDERVARAIFDSEIPVISAVGHEPDVTISDYVADLRAATPSNAAELAVPDMAELKIRLAETENTIARAMQKKTQIGRERLGALAQSRALQDPGNYIADKRMLLDFTHNRLSSASRQLLDNKKREFVRLTATLDALSPLKVLGRGYSIAKTTSGTILKKTTDAEIGEKVEIDLTDGQLVCTVDERKINDEQ